MAWQSKKNPQESRLRLSLPRGWVCGRVFAIIKKPHNNKEAEPGEEVSFGSQLILTRSFLGLRHGDQLLEFVSGPR